MEAHVDWASPAALWNQFRGPANDEQRRVFRTPAIFRFASDAYMQELLDQMQTNPHRVAERLAAPETWTRPVEEAAPIVPKRGLLGKLQRAAVQKLQAQQLALVRANDWNGGGTEPLKLFHPAAQRYYVIAASLICRTLGLPDHPVNTSAQERVGFVLRMVDAGRELAFVHGLWQPATPDALLEGEELNLMSPLTYVEDDGRRRRMFNGVIPVAKREAYVGAPKAPDAREISLSDKVLGPWANLEDVADAPAALGTKDAAQADIDAAFAAANAQLKTMSALILADFDAWLKENINPVWQVVHGTGALTDPKHVDAYEQLGEDLRSALRGESPEFKFVDRKKADRDAGQQTRKDLKEKLLAAIDVVPFDPAQIPPRTSPSFVARCVYERPVCGPGTSLLSEATTPFQLASFFDADAPARPMRIEMPADTTPDGLSKYAKSANFVMSDILCGQVSALRSMTFADLVLSVLPFPFHKPLKSGGGNIGPCIDGGMVCSLSIPIITICALVLLMIFVKLLDAIFFWMPFFQVCFPTNFPSRKG